MYMPMRLRSHRESDGSGIPSTLSDCTILSVQPAPSQGRCEAPRREARDHAPAITGHQEFERYFRVQQNTLEHLIVLIPGMLMFAWYLSYIWAAVLGLMFVVARIFYAYAYIKEPARRHYPAVASGIVIMILVLGGLVGVILRLFDCSAWVCIH